MFYHHEFKVSLADNPNFNQYIIVQLVVAKTKSRSKQHFNFPATMYSGGDSGY